MHDDDPVKQLLDRHEARIRRIIKTAVLEAIGQSVFWLFMIGCVTAIAIRACS
jgi:hypothetical protein